MNSMEVFKNETFGEVRTAILNGEPYFMLADVCRVLEIKNPSQVLTRLNTHGLISNEVIDNIGRKQLATFINESNLYKLVFTSRKKEAEAFEEWVTGEVLPSIRKTGSYSIATVPSIPSQYKCTIATNDAILMAKSLMQTFHVEDGIAYAKAFDVIGDANSIDFSPIRCLLPSPTKEVAYLNPTAIGKQFNMSAIAINKRLEEEGLQTRINADWRLTDEGAKYGSEKPYTKNGHSGWQILWSDKIIQFLSSGTTKSILVKN